MNEKRVTPLPSSEDKEFWGDGEQYLTQYTKKENICSTHTKDCWLEHTPYKDNKDGTISCLDCGWGTSLGGRYRVLFGRIIDLKTFNKS